MAVRVPLIKKDRVSKKDLPDRLQDYAPLLKDYAKKFNLDTNYNLILRSQADICLALAILLKRSKE